MFICYKTDRAITLLERDLLVLRKLADLEKSALSAEEVRSLQPDKQFLRLAFNLDVMQDLSRTIKESLLGPVGDNYLEHRNDLLFDLAGVLWKTYLSPVQERMDLYAELRAQKEFAPDLDE